jgi:hypothetical protein
MAIKEKNVENITQWGEREVHICSWNNLLQGDEGVPLQMPASNDRSVQVVGTFDGAAIEIQGSNDGVNYSVLADPQGLALSFNSSKIEVVLELTRYIKPVVVGGGASTNLNVVMLVRKESK